jgi:hypothetical protein
MTWSTRPWCGTRFSTTWRRSAPSSWPSCLGLTLPHPRRTETVPPCVPPAGWRVRLPHPLVHDGIERGTPYVRPAHNDIVRLALVVSPGCPCAQTYCHSFPFCNRFLHAASLDAPSQSQSLQKQPFPHVPLGLDSTGDTLNTCSGCIARLQEVLCRYPCVLRRRSSNASHG